MNHKDIKASLDELTKSLQELTEFEKESEKANYMVGGTPQRKEVDSSVFRYFCPKCGFACIDPELFRRTSDDDPGTI